MMKTKFSHKVISIFLVFTFLPSVLPMNYLYASNNGPNAPEAASFEPVDATDMVNLSTGDLSYVLPLLNIPSPEGGYPLSLSYHAGIAMDQEASWVGMGWSLNAGAINRNVSGIPDDWKEGTKADVIYNIGGESKQKSFSASVGWGDNGSIGMYISHSSNRAFGGERTYTQSTDFGVSAGMFGVGARVGTDGVGVSYNVVSAIATPAYNADTGEASSVFLNGNNKSLFSVSADYNFKNGNITGSISKNGLGISLGNNYGSVNIGQGSISLYGSNSTSSRMNLQINGFMVMIPIYDTITINYSEKKTRYWVYDRLTYEGIGSLYANTLEYRNSNDPLEFANHFDSYESIYEYNKINKLKTNNYSFVSYDDYQVSGQGVSGQMKPRILELGAVKNKYQNVEIDSNGDVASNVSYKIPSSNFKKGIANNNDKVNFYFENVNASFLKWTTSPWSDLNQVAYLNEIGEHMPNSTSQTISSSGETNYNSTTKQASRGNYVKTFTNSELNSGLPSGFINTQSKGFDRISHVGKKSNDGIGAFQVTTIDGKTYHYSLPVYQKEKFSRSSEIDVNIEDEFFEEQSLDAYATHWLLTAVTGPDYIDVNNDNLVNDSDYGYWVNFEYGKWSDGYSWRNPVGTGDFLENDVSKSYTWGVKEVYYLNKINTRTHSAFFVKEAREDNMSTSFQIGDSRDQMKHYNKLIFGHTTSNILFGTDGNAYLKGAYQSLPFDPFSAVKVKLAVDDYYYIKSNPHKSLKLNKILLYKNEDIPNDLIESNPNDYQGGLKTDIYIKEDLEWIFNGSDQKYSKPTKVITDAQYFGEFYNNVLEELDINKNTIEDNASKVLDFNYDYSSFQNAPNAYGGKLNLLSVQNKGKNGISLVPPYKFEYQSSTYSREIDDWGYSSGLSWSGSLRSIRTPTGANINIEYEEDDYQKEIIPTRRVFDRKLQFSFSTINNKLRILIENEQDNSANVSFSEFFEVGKTDIDFWSCYVEDYFAGGCKSKSGKIDIPMKSVDVISVSTNSLELEAPLDYINNSNGGLDELFGNSPFGLEYHNGMIRVEKLRGECEQPDGCINVTPRLVLQYFLYGNKDIQNVEGGGIRVKKISVSDISGNTYSSNYYYNEFGYSKSKTENNYKSSGVTSYAPARYTKEVKYINELPSPYVIYQYVTVEKESNDTFVDKTQYHFKVLENLIDIENEFSIGDALKIKKNQSSNSLVTITSANRTAAASYNNYTLEDNLASIGSLLEIKKFNSYNQLLNSTQHFYKTNASKNQGIIEEAFVSNKYFRDRNASVNEEFKLSFASSSKITYPNVLDSIKTTTNGFSSTIKNEKFDFNTGLVLETSYFNSKGKEYKTQVVPAYTKYGSMGSKVQSINNKNMLLQEVMHKSYEKVDDSWKEIGVGITTWNNDWVYTNADGSIFNPTNDSEKVWRKHKNFTWEGTTDDNGIFTSFTGEDDNFIWTDPDATQPRDWKQTSEVTKYNHFSMALEAIDVNENKTSTKMGDQESKIFATGNAGYDELFYSGAEDLNGTTYGGEVNKGTATENPTDFHTGKKALDVSSGQTAFVVSVTEGKSKKYKVSLWAKHGTHTNVRLQVGGGAGIPYNDSETVRAKNWVQLNFYFDINGTQTVNITSNGALATVDDFRLHPVVSSMTSYVYNEWDELTHILGSNNLATEYRYDAAGRLKETRSEVIDFNGVEGSGGFKKVSENEYTYKY